LDKLLSLDNTNQKSVFFGYCARIFVTLQHDYEKSRNEKSRNMENPFKFGTIVEEEYFTDRVKTTISCWEVRKV